MPLFRRADGDPVAESPVRRIMPYLMRGRNESTVYQDTVFRIAAARSWLHAYNRSHADRATLFHLVAYASARALHERPVLNRFVSGGRIWQRRTVTVAFAAKVSMADDAPAATVKLEIPRDEPFEAFVARIVRAVERARAGGRSVDREVAMVMRLPGPLIRALVALVRWLDAWNLLPAWFTRDDPMYSSLFLANLGSAGISDAYHHLYEYGTCSVFGAISAPRRMALVDGDAVSVEEALQVRWTLDERIGDAFYGGRSLALVRRILEEPERHLGAPRAPLAGAARTLAP
ncbi:MAG TPA: hypothetical protein VLU43_11630 [Anaeromyxobacteraceae bacterium]|nr:hypothetical protein [Anaeromyxobacteraceae bacterium]